MITLPFNPQPTVPEQAAAQQVKLTGNQLYQGMLNSYIQAYNLVWANKTASPDKIIAAMGTDAVKIFTLSAGMAVYLNSAGANVPTTSPANWTVVFNIDGTASATLNPTS